MTNGLHHLHLQRRLREIAGRPHKHTSASARGLDRIMYVTALVSPLVLVPQVMQLYRTHDTSGISISTWALLFVINALWTAYSVVHREWQLFLTSFLMGALDVVIVVGILSFS